MKRMLRWVAVVIAMFFLGVQFVRPLRTNPSFDGAHALQSHVDVPSEVGAVLGRACMDCHSNQTRWPWYSNVAPASWFVADHVDHGRRHLNFSTWARYDRDRAEHLMGDICKEVKSGTMPMPSYLLLHPGAKLTPQDVKTLCDWSTSESRRLASAHADRMPPR